MKIALNPAVKKDLKTIGTAVRGLFGNGTREEKQANVRAMKEAATRVVGKGTEVVRQHFNPSLLLTRNLKQEYDRLRAQGKSERQAMEAVVAMTRAALKDTIEAEAEGAKKTPETPGSEKTPGTGANE